MDIRRPHNLTTMALPTDSTEASIDNTVTFIVGFVILLIFVFMGILASIFLCLTLKKDEYLWKADRERQLQQKVEADAEEFDKTRTSVEKSSDNTQI